MQEESLSAVVARGGQVGKEIVIVCNSYPPEIGAAPTRIYNLAQLLKSAGYRVEVFCALPNYPTGRILPEYRGKLLVREEHEGIAIRRLPILTSPSRKGVGRAASMLTHSASLWFFLLPRLLRRRPDLVIVSSPPLPMAAAGVTIAKAAGCKVLLNVSDLWPLSALELGAVKKGRLYSALEKMERRMYLRAVAVMGQSEEILSYVHTRVQRPTFLYRNLPGRSNVEWSGVASRTPRRIVYAGQLGPVQGIAEICAEQDFAGLGLELHLYGDGPMRSRIEEIISVQGRRDIVLHDPVPLSALQDVLIDYDAALVPLRKSLTGAVPSKLFTAVGAGLPVVFCGGGEGAKLIEENGLGWTCQPGHRKALSDVLESVAWQPEEAHHAMRKRCAEAAENIFSKSRQDAAFLSFLSRLLEA